MHDETLIGSGTPGDPLGVNTGPTYGLGPTIEGILQPAYGDFPPVITIYARTFGSDATGDGSLANPYATFQRAIRDVPHVVPPGTVYFVDITGIDETLPAGYQLPVFDTPAPYVAMNNTGLNFGYPFFAITPVNIVAVPQQVVVPGFPASEMVLGPGDFTLVADPATNLVTLTLTGPARPSWAANALAGKFLVSNYLTLTTNVAIRASTPTTLTLVGSAFTLPGPGQQIVISEPSATLRTTIGPAGQFWGMQAIANSIAFSGLKITNAAGGPATVALNIVDASFGIVQLCDVEGLSAGDGFLQVLDTIVRNKEMFVEVDELLCNRCYFLNLGTFAVDTNVNLFITSVFEGLPGPIQGRATPSAQNRHISPTWDFVNVEVVGSLGVPVNFGAFNCFGGTWGFLRVKVLNSTGDGISVYGSNTFVQMERVNGTGNAGVGIRVHDGAMVRVRDNNTLITGALGDLKVGELPIRTWTDFRTGPGGKPIKNEYDLKTPFNAVTGTPGGDEETGAGTGGRSGSRLYQRP